MKESIYYISLNEYLDKRKAMQAYTQSLFDFLYCTGARISEAFKIEPRHFNFERNTVFIPTLKNPNHPLREVRLIPNNKEMLSNIAEAINLTPEGKIWVKETHKEPRKYAWKLSKSYFGCTTHSFRHTHATMLVRDFGANLHELMQEMGWTDPKPALIYVQYAFGESLDKKIAEYYDKKIEMD